MRKINIKKNAGLLNVILVLSLVTGCGVTESLWESTRADSYHENVSSILIAQDHKKFVVATDNYHYIFEMPTNLDAILQSKKNQKMSAKFSEFKIDPKETITGAVTLGVSVSAGHEFEQDVIQLGFSKREDERYRIEIPVTGIRYSSGGLMLDSEQYKLRHSYSINVREPATAGDTTARVLLSPITVSVDGIAAIAATPLFAIGVVTMVAICSAYGDDGCK